MFNKKYITKKKVYILSFYQNQSQISFNKVVVMHLELNPLIVEFTFSIICIYPCFLGYLGASI